LAGGCPQPVAASALFRMVSPGGPQERNCNLAPKLLLSLELITTKLIGLTRLVRRKSACTARS
jgi:hypothetical protein